MNTNEKMEKDEIAQNVLEKTQENMHEENMDGLPLNKVICGEALKVLKGFPSNSIDTLLTDPPAGINFMSSKWDSDKGGREQWIAWLQEIMEECYRVLKPGATALVWAIPRTSHWTATAVENAGFEVKDIIMHIFGSGFPKSLAIGKAIDKMQGNEREVVGLHERQNYKKGGAGFRQLGEDELKTDYYKTKGNSGWDGWGTALKPAAEHWILAMKPNTGTYAQNALEWGVSGLWIDGGRVDFASEEDRKESTTKNQHADFGTKPMTDNNVYGDYSMVKPKNFNPTGRFPANIILECICDLLENNIRNKYERKNERKNNKGNSLHKNNNVDNEYNSNNLDYKTSLIHTNPDCPCYILDKQSGVSQTTSTKLGGNKDFSNITSYKGSGVVTVRHNDKGGASRFFANIPAGDRFFYTSKSSKKDRTADGQVINQHPTCKPTKLLQYLVRLTKTPTGGIVLDPFAGSGTCAIACIREGRPYIMIEQDEEYCKIIRGRVAVEPVPNKLF